MKKLFPTPLRPRLAGGIGFIGRPDLPGIERAFVDADSVRERKWFVGGERLRLNAGPTDTNEAVVPRHPGGRVVGVVGADHDGRAATRGCLGNRFAVFWEKRRHIGPRQSDDFEVFFLDTIDESFLAEDFDNLAEEPSAAGLFLARMNEQLRDAPDDRLRRMLARARDAGLSAFREQDLPFRHREDSIT